MESQSKRFERLFNLEVSDFKVAWSTMAEEEKHAFRMWTIHTRDQLSGEAAHAQRESDIYARSMEILRAKGLGTPGTTINDVLPLLTSEERSIIDQAQQIYEKSFGVTRLGS